MCVVVGVGVGNYCRIVSKLCGLLKVGLFEVMCYCGVYNCMCYVCGVKFVYYLCFWCIGFNVCKWIGIVWNCW